MDKDNNRMETNDRFSKSGTTKNRWRDEIVKFAGMTWHRTEVNGTSLGRPSMAEMMMMNNLITTIKFIYFFLWVAFFWGGLFSIPPNRIAGTGLPN